jgi:hypothetical protein
VTDYVRDEALTFLEHVGSSLFCLYFTPLALHAPATPAPGDANLLATSFYRGRGYGEGDRRDQPAHIRKKPCDAAAADAFHPRINCGRCRRLTVPWGR